MNCVIYATNNNRVPMFEQHNKCAEFAKRQGYSIEKRYFDIRGDKLHEAVNQCLFYNVDALLIYDKTVLGTLEDFLFYRIYLEKFDRCIITCK